MTKYFCTNEPESNINLYRVLPAQRPEYWDKDDLNWASSVCDTIDSLLANEEFPETTEISFEQAGQVIRGERKDCRVTRYFILKDGVLKGLWRISPAGDPEFFPHKGTAWQPSICPVEAFAPDGLTKEITEAEAHSIQPLAFPYTEAELLAMPGYKGTQAEQEAKAAYSRAKTTYDCVTRYRYFSNDSDQTVWRVANGKCDVWHPDREAWLASCNTPEGIMSQTKEIFAVMAEQRFVGSTQ